MELNSNRAKTALLAVLLLILMAVMVAVLPPAVDWQKAYRPAARTLLAGDSPYEVSGYFNPPWALLPLLPIAVLPQPIGRALAVMVALAAYAYVAYKLGADRKTMLLFLLSPPVLHGLLNGSIDWLGALGFVMAPQIGLFFVLIKPQIGIAVAVFWLFQSWDRGGWQEVLRVFAPITIVTALTFVLFGLWPLRFEREIGLWWNASLWPLSIPVGLTLLVAAIKRDEVKLSIAASPCLSPYVLLHSWVGGLFALSSSFTYMATAVIGLWLVVFLQVVS